MSAYGHQMEREYSARSLSSRGGSEMNSSYTMESGFYMSSFAATLFIAGLVIIGVMLVSLLIALTVMLQSCESKCAGAIQFRKSSDDDHGICGLLSLHAELNNWKADEVDEYPSACKELAVQFVRGGQFARELNTTIALIERYYSALTPADDGFDAILLDIDDILPSNSHLSHLSLTQVSQEGSRDFVEEAKHLKHMYILKIYTTVQAAGWSLILLSRKAEGRQHITTEHLMSAGFKGWSLLILRSDDEVQMDTRAYFSRQRELLRKDGFRISGIISSQMDALSSSSLEEHVFKIPNPVFYKFLSTS